MGLRTWQRPAAGVVGDPRQPGDALLGGSPCRGNLVLPEPSEHGSSKPIPAQRV